MTPPWAPLRPSSIPKARTFNLPWNNSLDVPKTTHIHSQLNHAEIPRVSSQLSFGVLSTDRIQQWGAKASRPQAHHYYHSTMWVEGPKIVLRLCGSEGALLTVEIVGAKPASQAIPLSARTLHLKHARMHAPPSTIQSATPPIPPPHPFQQASVSPT
jgi:hypothetical protein